MTPLLRQSLLVVIACAAGLAQDAAATLGAPVSGTRSVDLRAGGGLEMTSFLDARDAPEGGAAGTGGPALLGVRAGTALAEGSGRAVVEYSVAVPGAVGSPAHAAAPGPAMAFDPAAGADGADRRLLRVRLDRRWRQLDTVVRLFHVGDEYGATAPARDHLNALGLPGAGQGVELTATWALPDTALEPRVRRIELDGADGRRVENARSLRVRRGLPGEIDLIAGAEATDSRRFGRHSNHVLEARTGARTWLELDGDRWHLSWSAADHDRRGSAAEGSDSTRLGLHIDAPGGIAVVPSHRVDRRHGGVASELASSRLGLAASVPLLRRVEMEFEYRDREESGADAHGIAAALRLRRSLGLGERMPQGFVLDAALSWRDSDNRGRPLWDDGVGVQLSLEYQRSALR